ncbi:MAG: polysaccharide biosynthesis C-terminal domain-containing protein [Spirochaeta sp.]|nr:polysaccharide biosynthesis C-terminal domain-containing protein [Spirochaeta sp.]
MRARILSDPIPRLLWRLSLPSIAGLLLVGINQLIDGVFVGQFVGEAGLGGVSLALPLTQVTLGLGAMIGSGAGSILSRAIGADNKLLQSTIIPAMNSVALLLAVAVALIVVPNAAAIIRIMGGTGELVDLGSEYLRIMAAGAIFPIWGLGSNLLIRAEGRMVAAMVRTSVTVIANTILNYIFMGVLGWGMTGAALATVLAMALFCLTGISYFSSNKPTFETRVAALSFDRTLIREIVSVGAPSLVLQVMGLIQQLVTYRLLAYHGGAGDIAFFGAVHRLFFVALLPANGFVRALQPVVGINYGAGKYRRVRTAVVVFLSANIALLLGLWLLLNTSPSLFLSTMLPGRVFTVTEIGNYRLFVTLLPMLSMIFITVTYLQAGRYYCLP